MRVTITVTRFVTAYRGTLGGEPLPALLTCIDDGPPARARPPWATSSSTMRPFHPHRLWGAIFQRDSEKFWWHNSRAAGGRDGGGKVDDLSAPYSS